VRIAWRRICLQQLRMREVHSSSPVCPTCAGTRISAPYRAESVVYFACADCSAVWPVDTQVHQSADDRQPRRQKSLQDPDQE
jgi:hypothetical protein